ncbi:hypothetical protein J0H58_14820 [bacterium]|nr:hypothetical protein [bacterium]
MVTHAALPLGRLVAPPGALAALDATGESPAGFLARHQGGDYGEVSDEDRKLNEAAVRAGERVLSAYRLRDGTAVWVLTEADRSSTTIMLSSEY